MTASYPPPAPKYQSMHEQHDFIPAGYTRQREVMPMTERKESYQSEYAMSAGDNAVTRKRINQSIQSKATANEGEFVKALMKKPE